MIDELIRRHADDIRRIARQHGAVRVRVVASRASRRARESSDIDLLVDLEAGRDLLDLVAIKQDLEAALGRPVDVVEEEGLSPYVRDEVLREAIPL